MLADWCCEHVDAVEVKKLWCVDVLCSQRGARSTAGWDARFNVAPGPPPQPLYSLPLALRWLCSWPASAWATTRISFAGCLTTGWATRERQQWPAFCRHTQVSALG